jgi:hypothetical protein
MKELIVIISDGPMGSTTIASIIGNYGYLNFPLRHMGLNQYLNDEFSLDNPFFINRVKQCVEAYTVPRATGGRSVIDSEIVVLFDKKIKAEIDNLENKKFLSIQEKYLFVFTLFNKHCLYKKKLQNYNGIIELTTDIHHYEPSQIQKKYIQEFKKVKFISLKRNFKNWLNSVCSHRFRKKNFKIKYFIIRLSSQIKRYKEYNKFVNDLKDNTIIQFEDIFKKNFLDNFLKEIEFENNINFKDLKFDHYGKLLTFSDTFESIDDSYYFLNKLSFKIMDYAEKFYDNKILRFLFDIIFQIIYLKDHFSYKINKKPKRR